MVERTFANPLEGHYSRPGGPWFDQTLGRLLLGMPSRPDAVVSRTQAVGTGDLLEHAQRVAGALRERGVGRGDPVAWQLPNGVDPIVLYWATWWLGAVAVPFHPDASAREAESVFTRVVPAITIATADA